MIEIERIAPDTLRLARILEAPVETVWRHLVESVLRGQWFAAGALEPRAGGPLELVFDHDRLSADEVPYPEKYARSKGVVSHERVVAIDPPRLLSYSWDGGREGVVTFELFAEGPRTRLVLTHKGISGPGPMADFAGGWHAHLGVLGSLFAGAAVRDFWALHAESQATVAEELGASA